MSTLEKRVERLEAAAGNEGPGTIFVHGDTVIVRGKTMTRAQFDERWPEWDAPVFKLGGAKFLP